MKKNFLPKNSSVANLNLAAGLMLPNSNIFTKFGGNFLINSCEEREYTLAESTSGIAQTNPKENPDVEPQHC